MKRQSDPTAFVAFVRQRALFTSPVLKGNDSGEEAGHALTICQSSAHFALSGLVPGAFEFISCVFMIASPESSGFQSFTGFAMPS